MTTRPVPNARDMLSDQKKNRLTKHLDLISPWLLPLLLLLLLASGLGCVSLIPVFCTTSILYLYGWLFFLRCCRISSGARPRWVFTIFVEPLFFFCRAEMELILDWKDVHSYLYVTGRACAISASEFIRVYFCDWPLTPRKRASRRSWIVSNSARESSLRSSDRVHLPSPGFRITLISLYFEVYTWCILIRSDFDTLPLTFGWFVLLAVCVSLAFLP